MSTRNRIVGTVEIAVEDLRLHPLNPKQHGRRQKEVLRQLLGEIGWVEGVIVNVNGNTLLDGEGRVVVAKHRGETTVPATLVDLSEEEEALALGTIDPIAEQALADAAKLEALYLSLDGLSGPLLDLAHLSGALPDLSAVQEDVDGEEALEDEEPAPAPGVSDLILQFGPDHRVIVDKDAFVAWRYTLMEEAGFAYREVVAELRRRLGLPELVEELL